MTLSSTQGVPGGCEAAAAEEEAEEARVILLHAQVDDRIQKDLQTFLARCVCCNRRLNVLKSALNSYYVAMSA